MPEPTEEPAPAHIAAGRPFMVIDRITQELISAQLNAAIEQLDIIAGAIRDDPATTNLSLVYVNAVNARTHVDEARKQLPWAPILDDGRRPLPPA